MANVIKYKTTQPTKRGLRRGNLVVGIGDEGYGPTSTTGYVNGITPPNGGYVVYTLDGTNPNVYVADSDDDLPAIARTLGWSGEFDYLEAINYLNSQNNIWVIHNTPSNTVTDGLVLDLNTKHMSSFLDNKPLTNVATTNTWRSTWNNSGEAVWNDNDPDVQRVFSNITVQSMLKTTNGNSHLGVGYVNSLIADGVECTYSLFIYIPSSNSAGMSGAAPYMRPFPANYNATYLKYNGSSAWGTWPRNKWIRIEGTATPAANGNGGISTAYISSYLNTAGDKVYYTAPQFELGSKATPFTSGSRSQNTDWYDLSGNSNDSTLTNSPTFENGAIEFDGVDDYATINSDSSFNVNTRTVELTFKMNGSYSNFAPLAVYANGSSSSNRVWLGLQSSKFRMHGWGTSDPGATTIINADRWYTCVWSYDKGTQKMKMYTNGVLENDHSQTQGGVNGASGMNWYLAYMPGGSSWQGQTYAATSISSFKVYDKILSNSEVSQNYYGSPIVTDNLVLAMDASNLVSYESGSTTTYSMTGSIYSGSLTNGVSFSNNNRGVWDFDGSDDIISIPTYTFGNGDWSLSVWANTNSTSNYNIMSNSSGGPVTNAFGFHGGNIFYRNYDGAWQNNSGNTTLSTGEWYLLTWVNYGGATAQDGTMKMFVNGVPDSGVFNSYTTNGGSCNAIGRNWFSYYNGKIANIYIQTKSLSDEEVLQNFNAQKSRFGL